MSNPVSSIVGGLGSAVGGILGGTGASKAGQLQKKYGSNANQLLQSFYDQTKQNFSPYMDVGSGGANALMQLAGLGAGGSPESSYLLKPITMTQQDLEATPGYQFALTQGLKGVQNSAAARGLGSAGAAMKGGAQYATGLADQTYKDQWQMAKQNQADAFARLLGLTQMGQGAAQGLGQLGANYASGMSNNLTGIGNALAGSSMSAWSGAGNAIQTPAMMYGMGMFGNQQQPSGMSSPYISSTGTTTYLPDGRMTWHA